MPLSGRLLVSRPGNLTMLHRLVFLLASAAGKAFRTLSAGANSKQQQTQQLQRPPHLQTCCTNIQPRVAPCIRLRQHRCDLYCHRLQSPQESCASSAGSGPAF
jgi:hypothetical protein